MFQIPNVKKIYLYPKPIPMNFGETKLTQICRDEMGIDPEDGSVFLFFNRKQDQIKLFFLDETGSQQFAKLLPKGGFLLPLAEPGEKFVILGREKVESIFK